MLGVFYPYLPRTPAKEEPDACWHAHTPLVGLDDVRLRLPRNFRGRRRGTESFLIDKVCAAGGHLGPNLRVAELTLALHRVFKPPRDALLLDIVRQA